MQTEFKFSTLIELFNGSLAASELADKMCLEIVRAQRQEKLTFGQLKERARAFALWLLEAGNIRVNDKVAILGRNRADWDVAFWGIILTGAVPVLIDPERGVEGVVNHLKHTDTRLLVMADDYQDDASRQRIREFAAGRGIVLVEMNDTPVRPGKNHALTVSILDSHPSSCEYPASSIQHRGSELLNAIWEKVKADDTAVILCTSGTTGDPREVELTHTNLIANIAGCVEKIKITRADVLGHILPPHHSFGLTVGKLLALSVGATNVYTDKYRQISELIRDKSVTIFVAIPALFTVLAKKIEAALSEYKNLNRMVRMLDRYRPKQLGRIIAAKQGWSKLRFFLSGAAPMPGWALDVFWRRGLKLYEGYGTTENSPVYGLNDDARKVGSVGKPIPTLSVKIVDEDNRTPGPGEKGEIVLGGPCIMKGYYKNQAATESVIEIDNDGVRWLHTGDLGYLDEDRNLFITGRKKYLIVLPGGKNVNPELVESVLSEAKYVKEILVVPGLEKDSAGLKQEAIRVIVRPEQQAIENDTEHSYKDLVKQPRLLKTLIWQSINECQQSSRQLSGFEKISSRNLEVMTEEFQKTSTGKIKREVYMKAYRAE